MKQTWQQRREEYLRSKGARELVVISGGRRRVVVVYDAPVEHLRRDAPELPDPLGGDCAIPHPA